MIRTVDTDVIVLAVANVPKLGVSELWILFSKDKKLCYLAIHEIANILGPQKALALPFFHAFTGCDVVSSFKGRGKKTAWNIWNLYGEVTLAFINLSNSPQQISDENLAMLERLTDI